MEPITSLWDPLELPSSDPHRQRIIAFGVIIVALFAVLVGRLYYLQIVEGDKYRDYADNNRFRLIQVTAPRGVIYDRHRILMVRNRPSYTVGIIPADLPSEPEFVFQRIAGLLGMTTDEVTQRVQERTSDPFTLIPLKTNVEEKLAFSVEERHLDLPGVHVVVEPTRDYLDGPMTSHILGYTGAITEEQYAELRKYVEKRYMPNDRVGQAGVEMDLEPYLRGVPGERRMEVDVTGREVRRLGDDTPQAGSNVVLTIDLDLQRAIANALNEHLDEYVTASAIAIDPRNGEVLALVHLPAYDNNAFARGITDRELEQLLNDPKHPLLNGAISAAYMPGSIFHTVVAAAGLQEGIIRPDQMINCSGTFLAPSIFDPTVNIEFPENGAHGMQDVVAALGNACNTFFYQVGGGEPTGKFSGLGIDRLSYYARLMGLVSLTGIGLPGEGLGHFPTPEWKQRALDEVWYHGDTYLVTAGQAHLTVTPIQVAQLGVIVANGGTIYRPRLVREILDAQDNVVRTFRPEIVRTVPLRPEIWEILQAGWRAGATIGETNNGAAYRGVAHSHDLPGVGLAGIATTVERAGVDEQGNVYSHGWFVGYAPYEEPRIVLTIFLQRGTGAEASAIGSQVLRHYFRTEVAHGG